MRVWVLSHLIHVQLFVILWTIAHQAPLSMGFSRQEYQSGLPCPPPGDRPNPVIKPVSPVAPASSRGFNALTTPLKGHWTIIIFPIIQFSLHNFSLNGHFYSLTVQWEARTMYVYACVCTITFVSICIIKKCKWTMLSSTCLFLLTIYFALGLKLQHAGSFVVVPGFSSSTQA